MCKKKHLNILTENQLDLLPLISQFKREYYLVSGTAIALQIGHRESIDFDLFKEKALRKSDIFSKIRTKTKNIAHGYEDYNQLNLVVNSVKFTFFQYPYQIPRDVELKGIIKMPDLLTLAAMKAFESGKRAKWKDYVDLYFLLKYHFTINEISKNATEIFIVEFSEKLFKMQLGFFKGINYDEEVTFLIANPPSEVEIKDFLTEVILDGLND